ncbi:MAG: hypothetical protein DWQ33_07085 [Bacteroidetes bacterium]|nr:MAG: hypothetical protein DWQ33_07085 [Bacteroidota bacterium]
MKALFSFSLINSIRKELLFCLSLLAALCSIIPTDIHASSGLVSVKASIDTNQIRIGEQFSLRLEAITEKQSVIIFPALSDSVNKFEIVQLNQVDTVKSADGKSLVLKQEIILTAWDSGYYVIEPLKFAVQNAQNGNYDTLLTEAFLVSVQTVDVDPEQDIRDIKSNLDLPITLKEILQIAGIVLLIVLAIILLIRYLKKQKPAPALVLEAPKKPAHEIALEELKRIESEKLWQQGYYKKYQSEVADTLRNYIQLRFDIMAPELTTDETLDRFRRTMIAPEALEKLGAVLKLADLVKFAKAIPVADENEMAMSHAYAFIELTRPVIKSDFKEKEEGT